MARRRWRVPRLAPRSTVNAKSGPLADLHSPVHLEDRGETQVSSTGSLTLFRGAEQMAKKTPRDPDEGLKRFLTDFRSHHERRSFEERRAAERRASDGAVDDDRRRQENRRDTYDRREMLLDRRRGISESFIREHISWIRDALLNAETAVACPRCEGDLLLGPTVQRGNKFVREVHCTACRHRAVIVDVPEDSG